MNMEDPDDTPDEIQKAIAALEAQRSVLGSAITNTALAALRQRLTSIQKSPDRSDQWLKQVSVVFVDVVDSTRISQGLDPEAVHAVMDGTLERLTSIVQAVRGPFLQYAGDSLLAVFPALAAASAGDSVRLPGSESCSTKALTIATRVAAT